MEAEERPPKMRKLDGDESAYPRPSKEQHKTSANLDTQTLKTAILEGKGQNGSSDIADVQADVINDGDDGLPAPEDVAPLIAGTETGQADPPLSKNQQKKLRKKAEWESKREERKAVRKEKQVVKRERKKVEKQREAEVNPNSAIEERKPPLRKSVQLPVTILIDCDFDDLMRDNERISLASQITRSHSDNKNSPFHAHLTVCSFGGKLKERFDTILTHYKNWKGVRFFDDDFVETAEKAREWMCGPKGGKLEGTFSKYAELDDQAQAKIKNEGEIVYLSSEADEDLLELKPYSTYIIGGLVDKNREKGVCYKRATRRNVRTAKLPIGAFMEMQSRKVLATNHVNEIMVKWLECGDWADAFMKVIPKRKGGQLKIFRSEGGALDNEYDDEHGSAEEEIPEGGTLVPPMGQLGT